MSLAPKNIWSSRTTVAATSLVQSTPGFSDGNTVVVINFASKTTAINITANTDSVGHAYSSFTGPAWDATFFSVCNIQYFLNTDTAPTTVTINTDVSGDLAIVVFELTANNTPIAIDTSANNKQTSATPTTGAITTSLASEIIFSGLTHDGATTMISPPTGFTPGPQITDATFEVFASAYQPVSSTQAAYNPNWALGSSRDCAVAIGSFSESVGTSEGWYAG